MTRAPSLMRSALANDSQYWRHRAIKMRAVVATMKDTHAHILMNDLADDYDRLAGDRERQATAKRKLK
jgi:hypothetical protein